MLPKEPRDMSYLMAHRRYCEITQSTVEGVWGSGKGRQSSYSLQSTYYEASPVPHFGKNVDSWIRSKKGFLGDKRARMILDSAHKMHELLWALFPSFKK